jgi:hypothetical protein
MRKCNICKKKKPDWMYKNPTKKTCQKCEFRWWQRLLRLLVQDRKLTRAERFGMRIGYMGVGFLIAGQWTVEPLLFIIGFICVLIQVSIRKQWNLVILQLNGLIAWTIHFLESLN